MSGILSKRSAASMADAGSRTVRSPWYFVTPIDTFKAYLRAQYAGKFNPLELGHREPDIFTEEIMAEITGNYRAMHNAMVMVNVHAALDTAKDVLYNTTVVDKMQVMVDEVTEQLDAFDALLRYLKTTKIDTWAKRCRVNILVQDAMKTATAFQKEKLEDIFGPVPKPVTGSPSSQG